MSTDIRPELSKNNPSYISKHRYYELKHFCLQYPEWKKELDGIDGFAKASTSRVIFTGKLSDPTFKAVEQRAYFKSRLDLVMRACLETDPIIGQMIFIAVTEGVSYDVIKARIGIPCCKDEWYRLYRKFFYILNNTRK